MLAAQIILGILAALFAGAAVLYAEAEVLRLSRRAEKGAALVVLAAGLGMLVTLIISLLFLK
jgi:uncharacterized protein YacL